MFLSLAVPVHISRSCVEYHLVIFYMLIVQVSSFIIFEHESDEKNVNEQAGILRVRISHEFVGVVHALLIPLLNSLL